MYNYFEAVLIAPQVCPFSLKITCNDVMVCNLSRDVITMGILQPILTRKTHVKLDPAMGTVWENNIIHIRRVELLGFIRVELLGFIRAELLGYIRAELLGFISDFLF